MKLLIVLITFLATLSYAQSTFNLGQIRPSTVNGQVITTISGQTVWATPQTISLTTIGSSGPSTLIDGVLNIPDYSTGGGMGCVPGGSSGYLLLDDGNGGCIDTDGSNTLGITALDHSGGGIFIHENGTGGIDINAGSGGFFIGGGSEGLPSAISGNALNLAATGFTAVTDDMVLLAQTNRIQLQSGTPANTGYIYFDTSNLVSGDSFGYVLPRASGTILLTPSTGVTWIAGSGAPSGSCINGSIYTSTTGTSTNILWACGSSTWHLVL